MQARGVLKPQPHNPPYYREKERGGEGESRGLAHWTAAAAAPHRRPHVGRRPRSFSASLMQPPRQTETKRDRVRGGLRTERERKGRRWRRRCAGDRPSHTVTTLTATTSSNNEDITKRGRNPGMGLGRIGFVRSLVSKGQGIESFQHSKPSVATLEWTSNLESRWVFLAS